MAKQMSYERARALFDYRDGELFWKRMESGRREDLRATRVNTSESGGKVVGLSRLKKYAAHYLIWNWHFGETEHAITFRDGDRMNCRIENLMQVPKSIRYTRKEHRRIPRADILPPQPNFLHGELHLTDLRIDCPCCGQSVAGIPYHLLAMKYDLQPMEERVLKAVWDGGGRPVFAEKIFDEMYVDDPDGGPPVNRMYATMKECMSRIKSKMRGSGVTIENVGYRAGFRIVLGRAGMEN
jgi:hypothetical protein